MDEILKDMEAYAKKENVPIINENGKAVLIEIAAAKRAKRILEIGTAIGYSALLLAKNSAEDVQITTLELSDERADQAEKFIAASPYKNQIKLLRGDAAMNMEILDGPFDLVFMDAAKGQYPEYFRLALPLLADDATIIADNVLFRGYVRSEEKPPRRYKTIVKRLREYIEIVEQHPEFTTKIYENGDGLAVSQRRRNVKET
jgi:predicted O-methyltransferase YrrM